MHRKPLKKGAKGQAAMEFLLTYGWAILIVLIVIGALAYFGVLSPAKMLPGKCMFQTGVQCQDYIASSESLIQGGVPDSQGKVHYVRPITFNLVNKLGKKVYIVGLGVEGETKNYECMEFKLDCEPGTDVFEKRYGINGVGGGAWYFEPGEMCVSLRKLCNKADVNGDRLFDEGYGLNLTCDPERALEWNPDQKLKAKLEDVLKEVFVSPDYANFYCLNLPGKGERLKGQIVITYHEGDPTFTHTAYGELVTTVE